MRLKKLIEDIDKAVDGGRPVIIKRVNQGDDVAIRAVDNRYPHVMIEPSREGEGTVYNFRGGATILIIPDEVRE